MEQGDVEGVAVDRNDHRNRRMRIGMIVIDHEQSTLRKIKRPAKGRSDRLRRGLRPRPVDLFISGFGCRDTIRKSDASKRSQA
ncbi:hypothetical protein FQZ97_1226340 [compost metagenome]